MNKKQMHQIHQGLNKKMTEAYCDIHEIELEVYVEQDYDDGQMVTWAKVAPCPECLKVKK